MLASWIRHLTGQRPGRVPARRPNARPHTRAPQLEALETRLVPTHCTVSLVGPLDRLVREGVTVDYVVRVQTGVPGSIIWHRAMPASASALSCATVPAIVLGPIAPARINGVMIMAWRARA